ncbi:MAG: heparinase II/III-family protein, partial [Anaerolineales bacterium]
HYDYRPVLQSAALSFLDQELFETGPWDEMPLWLKTKPEITAVDQSYKKTPSTTTIRLPEQETWAYFRIAHFSCRPGHADQLHLDMWWRGRNIAQDAGTYLYNAPSPWENSLSGTLVHNTVTIASQDQMTRAGRFLWLDWAQAQLISHQRAEDGSWESLTAEHEGYRHLGVVHRRSVTGFQEGRWVIKDEFLPVKPFPTKQTQSFQIARLHWLLPDWSWELEENPDAGSVTLKINSLTGWHTIKIIRVLHADTDPAFDTHQSPLHVQLVRAGESVYGEGPVPSVLGWVSPTYNHIKPALSFAINSQNPLPFGLVTEWILPPIDSETNTGQP